jgi:hypothetical protein
VRLNRTERTGSAVLSFYQGNPVSQGASRCVSLTPVTASGGVAFSGEIESFFFFF